MKKKKWNQKAKRRIVLASAVLAALLLACSVYAIVNTKRVKSIENNFTPSAVTIAVQESFTGKKFKNSNGNSDVTYTPTLPWTLDEVNKTYTANKEIRILNVNKADENNVQAYVRVCLVPRWCTQLTVENVTDGGLQEDSSRKVEVDVTNQEGYSSFGTLTDIKLENDNKYTEFSMGPLTFTLADDWTTYWIYDPLDGYFYYKGKLNAGSATKSLITKVTINQSELDSLDEGVYLQLDVLADGIQCVGTYNKKATSLDDQTNALMNRGWGNGYIKIGSNDALAIAN